MGKIDAVSAEYLEQEVSDYQGNPLIEALPPIYLKHEIVKLMTVNPEYKEGERYLDATYRFHFMRRLFRYFQPLPVHFDIEGRISRTIRQGYISRNPITPRYAASLAQGAEAIRAGTLDILSDTDFTASGFTIIGMSGVGKTTAVKKVLSLYTQTILHTNYKDSPLFLTQLVWARLDCPFDGSLKGLCVSFFDYVDRVLGTDYAKKFSVYRMTVDQAMPKMAQIARTHCLGLLVIDEIQHLHQARGVGQATMLNFFVTLVNTVGVPVVLIGTTKAMSILQSEFRQARRSSGHEGDLLWERMENDISWEVMLRSMWKYQWTQKRVELTEELKNVLYDESQGIIDIAVKLYVFAQAKAIGDGTEEVTVAAIREAAAVKLKSLKKYFDALRSGDVKKIAQYEDIRPISVDDYLAAQYARISPTVPNFDNDGVLPLEEQAVLQLLAMEIPSKIARSSVRKVIGKSTVGQPLSVVVKKAFKLALNMEATDEQTEKIPQSDDLRNAADATYENLKNIGVIAETADEF